MHNLTKIKIFRIALWCTYPLALLVLYPFALLRKKKQSSLFFLFDRYSIGGAQKIFLDILESLDDTSKTVYFTRRSVDGKLKSLFYNQPNTYSRDIHIWCDYLLFRLFAVHFYAFYLNRHKNLRILSSNSTFFFDLLPFLSKQSLRIELLHNFSYGNKGFEFFGLANYRLLDKRIVYDRLTLNNIRNQYAGYRVGTEMLDRVLFIEPGVRIPERKTKETVPPLRILYAGRGGRQKRVWLINRIAEHFYGINAPVQFSFAGTMEEDLSDEVKQASTMYGPVDTQEQMDLIYSQHHIILLTSAFEGFPMVIKEGMANGCVPLVTALEGNKTHLTHLQNAYLIGEIENEEEVVQQGISLVERILSHPEEFTGIQANAYRYAATHFTKEAFRSSYRNLLLPSQSSPNDRFNR